jgi:murein DD-endopeptidase MepM/ murein hydrolase activator NlpD
VLVTDSIKDNIPGVMNQANATGNTVMLKTVNGKYLLFAHFRQFSIAVKKGQQVKRGELLGLCGNSGNSSEPHLHFHIQNTADLFSATGIKCYFERINVDGKIKTDYSPIQGEKISNVIQ